MIGIYQDNFKDFLREFLGDYIKVSHKNIIVPCPFCGEYKQKKNHYHLYISLEAPIFHCFAPGCNAHGMLNKLFEKLEGRDKSENYIDKEKIKENKIKDIKLSAPTEKKKLILPEIREDIFKLKSLYLNTRLKFSNYGLKNIKGLIFDVNKFIDDNNIKVDNNLQRIKDYLHSNFIGFLTEKNSVIMFRNIDDNSDFRFFKLFISETKFLDYYKLYGGNYYSNHVVIAEGIFDIFNEHIFDTINLKNQVKLYAAGLSTSFESLIKSIVFNEKIYRLNVSVLADRGVELEYFKKIKRYNTHIIDQMNVYYNRNSKDFGDVPTGIEKFIL